MHRKCEPGIHVSTFSGIEQFSDEYAELLIHMNNTLVHTLMLTWSGLDILRHVPWMKIGRGIIMPLKPPRCYFQV